MENNGELKTRIAVLEAVIASNEKTLKLQAREYSRRLADLNGEAERLRQMQETYVPKSVYDIQHQILIEKIETNQKMLYIGIGILLALQVVLSFIKF